MKKIKAVIALIIVLLIIVFGAFSYIKIQTLIYPEDYSEYVELYSDAFDVDRELVYAVIKCESSFDKNAVSNVGAIGLMQLTPDTFNWVQTKLGQSGSQLADDETYTDEDLYDPEINIKYGTYLLRLHLTEFEDVKTALAAYHAGRGNVNSWLENSDYSLDGEKLDTTPIKETNAYIERVVKVRDKYDFLLNNEYIKRLRENGLL